jgi:hypothetical protein
MKECIYNLIPSDRFITRKELVDLIGISDREIRRIISDIRKEHSIISLSTGKGYRKCKSIDEMTNEEISLEYEIIKHQINENNSRIKAIKKNMRKQIARLKILEKNI